MVPSSEKHSRGSFVDGINYETLPLLNNSQVEPQPQQGQDHQHLNGNSTYNSKQDKQQQADTAVSYGTIQEDIVSSSKSKRDELVSSLRRGLSNFITHHTGSIGWLGSISIAVNSLTGPAMLNLPATFQKSGLIPTLVTLLFICVLSSLCSLHMANTISKVPGNENFKRHIEYSEVFRRFWGDRWFTFTQLAFFGCITCLNISSIVDTARVADTFLGHWMPGGGGSVALHFTGSFLSLSSTTSTSSTTPWSVDVVRWTYADCHAKLLRKGKCNPFLHLEGGVLLTLGYVLTTVALLPLALMDLKENTLCQIIGFVVLLVVSVQFAVEFAMTETFTWDHITLWGDSWGSLFGVILFNFCLVIAIPAWLYEKEPHVPVPEVIHSSYALSTFLYILVGVLGACSLPHVSENVLETMMSGAMGTRMQLGASVFAFIIIGFGVPLFSVLTRLNLTGSGTCSDRVGNWLAVYLPFGISWLVYNRVTELLSWGGIIFTSLVAFLLPLLLAWHTVREFDSPGSIPVCEGLFGWGTVASSPLTSSSSLSSPPLSSSSRRQQTTAVATLFVLAVLSVLAAILGLVWGK